MALRLARLGYRGLRAIASLSLARSDRMNAIESDKFSITFWTAIPILKAELSPAISC
jgi:hypothetical protein